MANYREDIVDIELTSGQLHRTFANHMLGEGDENCQRYGVRLFRNGEPEDITGASAVGYFIRADNQAVVLTGGVSGNVAWVELEADCFLVEGNFTLSIKITGADITNTLRVVDGTILDTIKGSMIDPGSVIPDLSDYMQYAEDIEAAAEVIEGVTFEAQQITGTRYKLVAALSE